MGQLTVKRTDQYANKLRKIQIFLDGQKLYDIANNETKTFDITDGQHSLFAKIDWCKTEPVNISIEGGHEKKFELGSPIKINPKSIVLSIATIPIFIIAIISIAFHNNLIFWIAIIAWFGVQIIRYSIFRVPFVKSPFYYLTFGRKEYIYLREI